ncbi:MAG: cytochrome c oxidase subunit 3 [Bacteroidia bacterium]
MLHQDNDDSFEPAIFERAAKIPPLKVLLFFVMLSISILFAVLLFVFTKTDPAMRLGGQHFPKLFFLSSALLIACSYLLEQAKKAFNTDNHARLQNMYLLTLAFGIGFCVAQIFGWQQLWETGIGLKSERSGAALYIISGLHVLHLLGGMVFLFVALFRIAGLGGDQVRALVYFSDPIQRLRVEMLVRYWHFLDILWLILFFYFLWFFL